MKICELVRLEQAVLALGMGAFGDDPSGFVHWPSGENNFRVFTGIGHFMAELRQMQLDCPDYGEIYEVPIGDDFCFMSSYNILDDEVVMVDRDACDFTIKSYLNWYQSAKQGDVLVMYYSEGWIYVFCQGDDDELIATSGGFTYQCNAEDVWRVVQLEKQKVREAGSC